MFFPPENSFLGGSPFVFPVARLRFLERKTWNENRGWDIGRSLKIEGPGPVFERRQKRVPRFQWGKWRRSQLGLQTTRLLLRIRWRQDCLRFRCSTRLAGSFSFLWFPYATYLYEVYSLILVWYSFLFSFFFLLMFIFETNRRFKDRYKDMYFSFFKLSQMFRKHEHKNIYIRFNIPLQRYIFFHFITNMKMHKIYYSSMRFFFFITLYFISLSIGYSCFPKWFYLRYTYVYIVKIILTKGTNDTIGQVVGETMRCNASIAPFYSVSSKIENDRKYFWSRFRRTEEEACSKVIRDIPSMSIYLWNVTLTKAEI